MCWWNCLHLLTRTPLSFTCWSLQFWGKWFAIPRLPEATLLILRVSNEFWSWTQKHILSLDGPNCCLDASTLSHAARGRWEKREQPVRSKFEFTLEHDMGKFRGLSALISCEMRRCSSLSLSRGLFYSSQEEGTAPVLPKNFSAYQRTRPKDLGGRKLLNAPC